MARRRDRVTLVIEESPVPDSPLAAANEREFAAVMAQQRANERLRDEGDSPLKVVAETYAGTGEFLETIVGTVGEWATEHARGHVVQDGEKIAGRRQRAARREKRDPDVRWRDEIEALRAWWNDGARVGRNRMEPSTHAAKVAAPEPHIDSGISVVARAFAALDATGAKWLTWAYIEIEPARNRRGADGRIDASVAPIVPDGRSAMSIAAEVRKKRGALPRWSDLTPGDHITWQLVVAEHAGTTCEIVDVAVRAARRALRDALRGVEMDCRPRWLVPLPSRVEMEREAGL